MLTLEFFQPLVPQRGAVLDLGCGWSEFINQIRAARRLGMDLNPSARGNLDSAVVSLHQDCSVRWAEEDGPLDTVCTSNCFEYLPERAFLGRTLSEALRYLKVGGRLLCLGPNITCLPRAYWNFWDHYLPLMDLSLKDGVELAGFRVDRSVGRFLPYAMDTGFCPPPWTVSLCLKLPTMWRRFGKQFLIVAVTP